MRIPLTISKNVYEAYKYSPGSSGDVGVEDERTLRSEDEKWDRHQMVADLRVLAVRVIAQQWQSNNNPILLDSLVNCDNRNLLLETLPTVNMPFELVISNIADEHYWMRMARDRWEHNNVNDHGGSWRRLYCERHLWHYLERLEATHFDDDAETTTTTTINSNNNDCQKLLLLVKDLIHTITLHSLQPSSDPFIWSGDLDEDTCRPDEPVVNHIDLERVLINLPNIEQVNLQFGMIYGDSGFEWRDFEFSIDDCKRLGLGLRECKCLDKFTLTRSNLDQPRLAALMQSVVDNNNLRELDLSHCKLGDSGAHAMGQFLTMHQGLRILRLTNNAIGCHGLGGIVNGMLREQHSTQLALLDLRLNPLGDEAALHVSALLLRHTTLEELLLSGCCLSARAGICLAEVIGSGQMRLTTLKLDLSNNDFGPIAGDALEVATRACSNVIEIDVRMCNISKSSEYEINESVFRNRESWRKAQQLHDSSSLQNSNVSTFAI